MTSMQSGLRVTFARALSLVGISVFATIVSGGAAGASTITSLPGGTVWPLPVDNVFTGGPETVASGITWTSTVGSSVYGWTGFYGFANNSSWTGSPPLAGLNAANGSMTFAFSTAVSAVGGLINWTKNPAISALGSISVLDAGHNLIESLNLFDGTNNLVTPNAFHGFQESSNNIAYFVLTGDYVAIRDLTTATVTPTPLPATLPLFASGLGLLGLLGWRRTVWWVRRAAP